jgi:multidrug efflux pump subunit AcrB
MSAIPRFSVRQPVLINLIMVGVFVGGFFSIFEMPQELNPNISFNWVFAEIPYPGASPKEVEDLVLIPIEKELDKIEKVKEIYSTAGEGWAFFMVEFEDMSDADFTAKMQEVRLQVDSARIPDEVEDPILTDFGSDDFLPVISVSVTSTRDPELWADVVEDLSDEIEAIGDVAKIQVSGLEEREIWVEVDPVKLNGQNLTLAHVVGALASRNVNFPGGSITVGRSEYQVRAVGRFESAEEIERAVLQTDPSGRIVYLRDVARVREVRAESTSISRLNGKPAITISASKKASGSTFQVVNEIREIVEKYQANSPEGIEFTVTIDTTRYISRILGVLRNNALIGIVFIFGILLVFLGIGNAALAALGIPLSFMITFILMHLTGNSINGSTVFAMIMVLGIIVDDAIIVLENVHSHRQRGEPLRDAVVNGTTEVLGPVTSGILTTIAAFLPLMLLPGIMGKFMRVIPFVVSLALLASLFEATVILPSHIHDWTGKSTRHKKKEFGFYLWLRERYERLLRRFLRRRYIVLGSMVALIIIAFVMIPLVGVEMFGSENFGHFTVLVKLPDGTSLEETDRVIRKIESTALRLPAHELEYVEASAGVYQGNNEWLFRKNVGQVRVSLVQDEGVRRPIEEVIRALRDSVSTISGITSVEFEQPSSGPPSSKPVSVRVSGKYLDELQSAVADLKEVLAGIEGVYDILDDFPEGTQEIRIKIDEERAALYGLSPREIALELHTAISGLTATTFRDGDEDVDVVVKLREDANNSLESVRALRMTSLYGANVPLSDVASITVHDTMSEIKRRGLKRTIIVSADLDESKTTVDRAVGAAEARFDDIARRYKDVHLEIGGEFEEFTNFLTDLERLFVIGLILIYLILGTQFRSYIQPLTIIFTVPFAFIGAMVGLMIAGDKFGIVTLFGFVALAGIVVNDAIVMVAFINNARRAGQDRWESIVAGGTQRLRPIILTSVTTIGGLLPTAVGIGGTSEVWRPLANTIAWGLLFSTGLTLLALPCVLSIVDDIKVKVTKRAVGLS